MHKKNVIAIILTAVIFISAAVLGVSSVYRVSAVTLDAPVISEAAKEEAAELQKLLLERYKNESIFFVKGEEAGEDFAKFPYFRMTSFKKAYPNRLVVTASEDAEVYAFKQGELYYILGVDGTILGTRAEPSNRSDGADNVIVTGAFVSGERGEKIAGDACVPWFLELGAEASRLLNGFRSNVSAAEIFQPTVSPADVTFCLFMREGVKVNVHNPGTLTKKKTEAFVEKYLSLEDQERLGGRIEVTDDALSPGEVIVSYSRET